MAAPSFSSFPPSFSSFPELPEPKKDEDHSEKRKHKSKDDGRDHDRKSKRKRDKLIERPKHELSTEDRINANDQASKYFFSDRKGDPLNIRYGGLHAGDVPKYRLVARGRYILGLPLTWTAFHRSGKGVEIGLSHKRKFSGLTDSSSRALLNAAPTRRLAPATTSRYQEIDGFIRISSHPRRPDKAEPYLIGQITQDGANSDSEESGSEGVEESDLSDDEGTGIQLTAHQESLKRLDQHLEADPSSISHWLQLLSQNLTTIPTTSKNAMIARSEMTLSIIGRALSAHPRNRTCKELLLKYLQAGEQVWHESKLRAEWERAFGVGGIELWMEWLEWRIRKAPEGIEGIVADASRVLLTLASDEDGELGKVRVFWRVAVAFQEAGFFERASAMFQAQAEMIFAIPPSLVSAPPNVQLDALEEFWESGTPRLGSTDGKGWGAWVGSGKPAYQHPQNTNTALLPLDGSSDLYRAWAESEVQADRESRMRVRCANEDPEGLDPYAVTLFSDIRSLLVQLRSRKSKEAFRLAWLSVLGLHTPGFLHGWDDRWSLGHLLQPTYLCLLFPTDTRNELMADSVAGTLVGRTKSYRNSFGPVRHWVYGALGPLDSGVREEGLEKARQGHDTGMWRREDVENVDQEFVRQLFRRLRMGGGDHEWDVLALTFESTLGVKGALKLSRSLLSTERDSVPHWAAHAHLERMRGKLTDSRKVYQTVLKQSADQHPRRGQLWWDWVEMEWLAGRNDDALGVVLDSVAVEGRGGTSVLRAKRFLEDMIQSCAADSAQWKIRESWIKLRALLEILTGGSYLGMLAVFDSYPGEQTQGVAQESLMMAMLLMLYQYSHILNNPMPTGILRERAERALEAYSSNSIILGLFLEGEKGQGVWGRVRGLMGESQGRSKDVIRRVQEVWMAGWEQGRWASEVERTRGGLGDAVVNERTRGSAILWRIYIELEVRAGQLSRAKRLFFQAIGECPLCKGLYLIAFGALRSVFSKQELDGIADTMAERGIRLRRGLDEILESGEFEKEEPRTDSEDSAVDDEIEENAVELRRLMPY